MDQTLVINLLKELIWLILLASSPVLVTSMVVGLLVSIVQTVTQVQEATVTFVPKMVASLAVLILTAPWVVDQLLSHARQMFQLMIELATHQTPSL